MYSTRDSSTRNQALEGAMNETPPENPTPQTAPPDELRARRRLWAGVVVLIIGLVFLAREIWGAWWDWGKLWPIVLIVVGVAVLLGGRKR